MDQCCTLCISNLKIEGYLGYADEKSHRPHRSALHLASGFERSRREPHRVLRAISSTIGHKIPMDLATRHAAHAVNDVLIDEDSIRRRKIGLTSPRLFH